MANGHVCNEEILFSELQNEKSVGPFLASQRSELYRIGRLEPGQFVLCLLDLTPVDCWQELQMYWPAAVEMSLDDNLI